jgi:hypothetical protein
MVRSLEEVKSHRASGEKFRTVTGEACPKQRLRGISVLLRSPDAEDAAVSQMTMLLSAEPVARTRPPPGANATARILSVCGAVAVTIEAGELLPREGKEEAAEAISAATSQTWMWPAPVPTASFDEDDEDIDGESEEMEFRASARAPPANFSNRCKGSSVLGSDSDEEEEALRRSPRRDAVLHRMTVPSPDPVANTEPSLVKHRASIQLVWPLSTARHSLDRSPRGFHNRIP